GGGTLSGTTTVAAVNGVATFSTLSIDKVGTGYTFAASATGPNGTTSTAFNITPGAASHLVFSVQPTTTTAGSLITPAVQVTAQDAQGNTATGSTRNITVATGANPGGGTLARTATVAAVSGVATFSVLSIYKTVTGYTLGASSGGLTGTSSAFNITAGNATQLVFAVQPTTTVAGASITPAVQVTARDGQGNTATGFTGKDRKSVGEETGGGTRAGRATVEAISGVATFSGLSIDKVGTGYTLVASSSGLTDPTSNAFNITAGSATQLVFTGQPSNTAAGVAITPAVQVTARDGQGNTATGFTGDEQAAIRQNPNRRTLARPPPVAGERGVRTSSGHSVDKQRTGRP